MAIGREDNREIKWVVRFKANSGIEFFLPLDFLASFCNWAVASLRGEEIKAWRKVEPLILENARTRRVDGVSSRKNVVEASDEDNSWRNTSSNKR